MTAEAYLPYARDDPMLTGGVSLFLCTPRADWMSGGVMSVNCESASYKAMIEKADHDIGDIEEMEAHKEEIQREGRNRLAFLNAKLRKGGHPWET